MDWNLAYRTGLAVSEWRTSLLECLVTLKIKNKVYENVKTNIKVRMTKRDIMRLAHTEDREAGIY